MPFADLQILSELLVDLTDLVVLSNDEVNFSAGLLNLIFASVEIILLLIPVLAKRSPLFLLQRQLLHLFSNFIFKLLLFNLFGSYLKSPLFAILFLVGNLRVINRNNCI